MNKCMLSLAASAVAVSAFAVVPEVSAIVATQDSGSRKVTVSYTLANEPAIITLSVETNSANGWVSIGDENLTHVAGDANKLVGTGDRSLTWIPHKAWPNQFVNDGNIRVGVKAWATNAPPEIMAVNLKAANTVHYYSSAAALPGGVTNDLYKTDYLVMRLIPAGNVTWTMGSPTTELQRLAARETAHEVTLADDFYIGVYEITQRQWELMMGNRPAYFSNSDVYATRPMENLSYVDLRGASSGYSWPANGHAVADSSFIGKLRAHSGLAGFELPTDAQWEFACRAESGSSIYNGKEVGGAATSANLAAIARYKGNDGYVNGSTNPESTCTTVNGTAKVGSYEPNAWGLYDMLGNVYERCLDWYADSNVGLDPLVGPTAATKGDDRVIRGGSWNQPAGDCRCACRGGWGASSRWIGLGARLACSK